MSCPNGSFDVLSMYIMYSLIWCYGFLEGYRQDKLVTSVTLVLGSHLGPPPKRFKSEISEFRSIDFLTFRATSFLMDDLAIGMIVNKCDMKWVQKVCFYSASMTNGRGVRVLRGTDCWWCPSSEGKVVDCLWIWQEWSRRGRQEGGGRRRF